MKNKKSCIGLLWKMEVFVYFYLNEQTYKWYIYIAAIFYKREIDFGLKEKMHLNIYNIDSIFLLMFK